MCPLKDRESYPVRSFTPFIRVFRNSDNVHNVRLSQIRSPMSLRLQANSRLLFRSINSHRVLFITLVAMLALAGVGISRSSAVKSTLSVITGNSEFAASTKSPAGTITVHAAGRGKPYLNFQDGSSM